MTERDLRRLLDDAADDGATTPVTVRDLAIRDRRERMRRRRGFAVVSVAAGSLAVVGLVVLTTGADPTPGGLAISPPVTTSATSISPTSPFTTQVTTQPAPSSTSGSVSSASCVGLVVVDGVGFEGYRTPERPPTLSGRSLPAIEPACNDTNQADGREREIEVEEIEGISTGSAVWFEGSLFVRRGADLPESTDKWFRRLACSGDGPTDLVGNWIGVTSKKKVRFDGDIRTPLTIDFVIQETTPRSGDYVGYTIRIADDGGADPALDKHAVEEALQSSRADLRVDVHCDGDDFVADSFELVPR